MGEYTVKQEIATAAERVWDLIADFGNVPWIQGLEKVEVEGDGPGMVRIMNGQIRECLQTLDPATRTLTYTIPEGLPVPLKNYHSTMRVESTGPQSCSLEWTCCADPDGIPDEQAQQIIDGLYGGMIGGIRDHLGAS